jgi:hypothetical protein
MATTDSDGHRTLMTTSYGETSAGQARRRQSGLQPTASGGIVLRSPYFGKLSNVPDPAICVRPYLDAYGDLEASNHATSGRCLFVKMMWLGTVHGLAAHTVRNIPATPSLWQAMQEIHGLEEIARTLK